MKICIFWQNLSGENTPKVNFLSNSTKYSKSNRKNLIMIHDFFWSHKVPNIIFIHNTYFIFFEKWINNMPILAKMLVPYRKTKSQLIHHFNMVHPRDISLTESWGSSRFFGTKEGSVKAKIFIWLKSFRVNSI